VKGARRTSTHFYQASRVETIIGRPASTVQDFVAQRPDLFA
jgi:hypothetical protein